VRPENSPPLGVGEMVKPEPAEKWQTLTEQLAELERTDPEVAAAAQRLDDLLWRISTGIPVTRFPRERGCASEKNE
jgi:hypothetical protein